MTYQNEDWKKPEGIRMTPELERLLHELEAADNSNHPAYIAYRDALFAAVCKQKERPLIRPAEARRLLQEAEDRCAHEHRQIRYGIGVGLWLLAELNADALLARLVLSQSLRHKWPPAVENADELAALQAEWEARDAKQKRMRSAPRRAVTDGTVKTGRTMLVDGVRVPIVESCDETK